MKTLEEIFHYRKDYAVTLPSLLTPINELFNNCSKDEIRLELESLVRNEGLDKASDFYTFVTLLLRD